MLLTLWLNSRRKFKSAYILILLTTNFLIAYSICTYGKEGSIQTFVPILIIFIFILFEKTSHRILFGIITTASFFTAFAYIDLVNPELHERTFKFDYYLNVGFAIVACAILSHLVMSSLKKRNNEIRLKISELESKNSVIAHQNQEMDLFTSMASHDLKTPVRTINAFLGLLKKEGQINDPKSQEYLNHAIIGANQLNTLVNGISAFKNVEEKTNSESFEDTNKILDEVVSSLGLRDNNSVRLTMSKLPDLSMSKAHIQQIFQNLIENGINNNESVVKKIDVTYILHTETVEIKVSDNGIGIDQNYLEYVFEPFKKIDSSQNSAGLGLHICNKIVTLYNGDIKANSNPNGTTISISLPRKLVRP